MGVTYDVTAFDQIQAGFDRPQDPIEAAVDSGDLVKLREAIGSVLLKTGERIGDTTLVEDASRYNMATAQIAQERILQAETMRQMLDGDDDGDTGPSSKKK